MLFALIGTVCIIMLTYFASKWYARKMGPIAGGRHIKVVDRTVVSKTGSILIIDVQGRQYMLGVSDQNVQILMELEEAIPLPQDHTAGGDGLKGLINNDGYKNLLNVIKKRRGVD
jgi:flagellar protein FliO/FliZ